MIDGQHIHVGGENMAEFIWHWRNGNKKIYTKRDDVAEKAMKEGLLVMGTRTKPHILKIR